jgi:hypothetical protein
MDVTCQAFSISDHQGIAAAGATHSALRDQPARIFSFTYKARDVTARHPQLRGDQAQARIAGTRTVSVVGGEHQQEELHPSWHSGLRQGFAEDEHIIWFGVHTTSDPFGFCAWLWLRVGISHASSIRGEG